MFQITVWQTKRMYHSVQWKLDLVALPSKVAPPLSKDKLSEVFPLTWISFFKKVLLMCWGSPSQPPSLPSSLRARLGLLLQLSHLPQVTVQGAAVSNTETKGCKSQVSSSTGIVRKSENVSNASKLLLKIWVDSCFQKMLLIRFTEVLSLSPAILKVPWEPSLATAFLAYFKLKEQWPFCQSLCYWRGHS